MKILITIAFSLWAQIASAQGYVSQPSVDLSYIANVLYGFDYNITSVEADPSVPGREIHVYVPGMWMITVGRMHPTKHGVYGTLPGPGLCLEPWTFITNRGPVWHFNSVGDFTGDGRDDFIVYFTSGLVDIYQGVGLSVCK